MPTSVIGGLGAPERLAILLDVYHRGHYEGLRGAEQVPACG